MIWTSHIMLYKNVVNVALLNHNISLLKLSSSEKKCCILKSNYGLGCLTAGQTIDNRHLICFK